jgi:LuxR family maltose regulon positive regulatory protein
MIAAGTKDSLGKATELLRNIRHRSEVAHITCQTIEATVLQSLALDKLGRGDEALTALEEVLALAQPGGWIRPFVEAGPPMAELFEKLHGKTVPTDYVPKILDALREHGQRMAIEEPHIDGETTSDLRPFPRHSHVSTSADPQPLVETLTNRELQVLELLAQRLQNKEIAQKLFIAPETVKAHLNNIYQKLGVSNRRQAVTQAYRLGILTSR